MTLTFTIVAIIGVIFCFMGFVSEVVSGKIAHLRTGREAIAAASIVPSIPIVPTLIVGASWLLEQLYSGLGLWTVIVLFAAYVPFWWRGLRRLRSELEVLRVEHMNVKRLQPDSSQASECSRMKKHWIEFRDQPPNCPMTYWIHRECDGKEWRDAEIFQPPRQAVVPGKGYPVFLVECDGFTFEFASFEEMKACIETLERKVLPRSIDLSLQRGTGMGPNTHWIGRLPAGVSSWRYRKKAIPYLRKSLEAFREEIA